jgi:hypothetical protein
MKRAWVLLLLACAHHPAATPAPPLIEHVVRPEAADPEADKWLQDQYALLDPGAPAAPQLVVYLVGANNKPVAGRAMMIELARMGFHVLAPMYADDYDIRGLCAPDKDPDDNCHANLRLEAFEGIDHSPHIEVKPANSIERRVARLLVSLHAAHPAEGWGGYLHGDRPAWDRIIIAGHSHGASSAGLIGKIRKVDRVVMLSGPFDNRAGAPAPWTRLTPATPIDRYFVFSHAHEEQYPQHVKAWETLAPGPLYTVDGAAPPYAPAHRVVSTLAPGGG